MIIPAIANPLPQPRFSDLFTAFTPKIPKSIANNPRIKPKKANTPKPYPDKADKRVKNKLIKLIAKDTIAKPLTFLLPSKEESSTFLKLLFCLFISFMLFVTGGLRFAIVYKFFVLTV